MSKFVEIKLSDDVSHAELIEGPNTPLSRESGEIYINVDKISSIEFDCKEISIWMSATGMGACGCASDYFNLHFTKEGMGEYHRLKREILDLE